MADHLRLAIMGLYKTTEMAACLSRSFSSQMLLLKHWLQAMMFKYKSMVGFQVLSFLILTNFGLSIYNT